MKNHLLLFSIIIVMVFAFSACTEDSIKEPEVIQENFEVKSGPSGLHALKWRFCIYDVVFGRKVYFPRYGTICANLPGICEFRIVDCFVWVEIDPCLFPCGLEIIDPWEIYELVDPREIISIPEKFNIKVDPETAMIPFPVNENIIGLQMYSEVDKVMDKEVLILENDIELNERFAKESGLESNIIPAGKYPVLYNEENETFNAFVSLGKKR